MKNYKSILVWAGIWLVIVVLGVVFTPEKTGFTERPVGTLVELLLIPYGVAAGVLLMVWAGKKLMK